MSIHLQLKKLNLWLEEYEIDSIKSHLQLAEKSINEFGTTPHHSAIELLLVQSKYQMLLGDYKMASRYGTSAVGQSSTLGDTSLLIRTYDCLARASYYLRNYITTDSLCYLSLDLLEEQAKDVDENTASIYSLLGLSHFRRWETDRAIELHEKALSINRRVFGDIHSKVARDYGNLANCYRDKSDYFRAIEYLQSTAVILKNIYGPEHQNLATTYYNLAMNYDNVEESDTSIAYYYKAMDIRKKQFPADHVYFGEYWEGIARNYADLQQFDTALFYYKKAESIYETKDLDQYNASGFRAKVGYVYFRMGKSKEAMSQYNSALEVRRKDYGERDAQVMFYRMMLGGINSSQGKFHEGQLWYNRALQPFDFNTSEKSYGEIPKLTNLLLTLRDKAFSNYEWYLQDKNNAHLDTAFSASQQALALLDYLRSGYREDESRLLLNQQYKNVIDQSLEIIHMLFEVTGQEKYLDFFFQSLERQKATSMLVQLTERNFEQHKNLPASLITEEQRLKTLLNQLEISQRKSLTEGNDSLHTIVQHHLFDTRRTYDKFVNSLATNAPSYYNLKFQSNFPLVIDVQQILDPGEILVSYDLKDHNLYTFYCTNSEKGLLKEDLTDAFTSNIASLRDSFFSPLHVLNDERSDAQFVNILKSLSEKLIAPLPLEELGIKRICLIPDGILNLIPFDCLLNEWEIDEMTMHTLPYLGMRYDIYSLHSASTFLSNRGKQMNEESDLIAFVPNYIGYSTSSDEDDLVGMLMRSGHLPLPGAEKEAFSISEIWKGRLWKGSDASEANFKAHINDGNIIHLSMHAVVDQEQPLRSTLLFSKGQEEHEDGYLYASELYDMSINAAMVVLSACNTGYGKMAEGEGTQSLSRAFAYAGVPSTVMSLWKIPDASSSVLMIDFYKNLKKGMSKPTALAEAKRNYLSNVITPELAHPFYWAGFIASGDPCPLTVASSSKNWFWILLLLVPILYWIFNLYQRTI